MLISSVWGPLLWIAIYLFFASFPVRFLYPPSCFSALIYRSFLYILGVNLLDFMWYKYLLRFFRFCFLFFYLLIGFLLWNLLLNRIFNFVIVRSLFSPSRFCLGRISPFLVNKGMFLQSVSSVLVPHWFCFYFHFYYYNLFIFICESSNWYVEVWDPPVFLSDV